MLSDGRCRVSASGWRPVNEMEATMRSNTKMMTILTAGVLAATLGMSACEKKGPVEKAGEEVDEAVNTIKNGGKETPADKLDDAGDKAADAARDAKDAVTK
jgi:hyperosmotically inducible protein